MTKREDLSGWTQMRREQWSGIRLKLMTQFLFHKSVTGLGKPLLKLWVILSWTLTLSPHCIPPQQKPTWNLMNSPPTSGNLNDLNSLTYKKLNFFLHLRMNPLAHRPSILPATSYSLNTRSLHLQTQPSQTLDLVNFQSSLLDHLVQFHLVRTDNCAFDLSSIDY
jgi:hypothetical protein